MKKRLVVISSIYFLIPIIILGTSVSEKKSLGERPYNFTVSFIGDLEAANGETLKDIQMITIQNKINDFILYHLPAAADYTQELDKKDPSKKINKMRVNPMNTGIKASTNLQDIISIEVPEPNTTWTYKQTPRGREIQFVEVIKTSKGGKQDRLLMQKTESAISFWNPKSNQQDSPTIDAIKKLTIKCFVSYDKEKEQEKLKKKNNQAQCPVTKKDGKNSEKQVQ